MKMHMTNNKQHVGYVQYNLPVLATLANSPLGTPAGPPYPMNHRNDHKLTQNRDITGIL